MPPLLNGVDACQAHGPKFSELAWSPWTAGQPGPGPGESGRRRRGARARARAVGRGAAEAVTRMTRMTRSRRGSESSPRPPGAVRPGYPSPGRSSRRPARLEQGRTGRNSVIFWFQFALVLPRPALLAKTWFYQEAALPARPGHCPRVCCFAREGFSGNGGVKFAVKSNVSS